MTAAAVSVRVGTLTVERKRTSSADTIGGVSSSGSASSTPDTPRSVEQCLQLVSAKARASYLHEFEQVPPFLRSNPFIRSGYRVFLSNYQCLESIFWWTNETINIWTHIVGFCIFFGVLLHDAVVVIPWLRPSLTDCLTLFFLVASFLTCMLLSVAYHTFNCQSERAYARWLQFDLAGVTLSFTSIFVSGIHYAYTELPEWKTFYLTVVGALTVAVVFSYAHPRCSHPRYHWLRVILFTCWGVFGFVPTIHWVYLMGGFASPVVQVLLPRIVVMYLLGGAAFLFYVTRWPERWHPGKVDFLGSSHQLWHCFVVLAMLWWHQTGVVYAELKNGEYFCGENSRAVC